MTAWFLIAVSPPLPLFEHFLPYYLFLPLAGFSLAIGIIFDAVYRKLPASAVAIVLLPSIAEAADISGVPKIREGDLIQIGSAHIIADAGTVANGWHFGRSPHGSAVPVLRRQTCAFFGFASFQLIASPSSSGTISRSEERPAVTSKGLCQQERGADALVLIFVIEDGEQDAVHRGAI